MGVGDIWQYYIKVINQLVFQSAKIARATTMRIRKRRAQDNIGKIAIRLVFANLPYILYTTYVATNGYCIGKVIPG